MYSMGISSIMYGERNMPNLIVFRYMWIYIYTLAIIQFQQMNALPGPNIFLLALSIFRRLSEQDRQVH